MNNMAEFVDDHSLHSFQGIAHEPPGKGQAIRRAAAAVARAGRSNGDRGGVNTHPLRVLFHKRRYQLPGAADIFQPLALRWLGKALCALTQTLLLRCDPRAVLLHHSIDALSAEIQRSANPNAAVGLHTDADAFSFTADQRIILHGSPLYLKRNPCYIDTQFSL